MSGIQGSAVSAGVDVGAATVRSDGRPIPRSLQAVLVLVRLLFVATLVGAIGALSTASSVDAVDGYLFGLHPVPAPSCCPCTSVPAASPFWRGLFAVQVWLVLGAVAELSGGAGAGVKGVARLALPVAVVVLLARPGSRRWFRLGPDERVGRRSFGLARMVRLRRDGGQSALEYLGLVVVALVGAMMATGIGQQLTAEMRAAICSLTGSSCPAPSGDVIAGPGGGSGSGDEGSGADSGRVSDGEAGSGAGSGGVSRGEASGTGGTSGSSGGGVSLDSRANYFSPERDAVSADSMALVVSWNADRLKVEEPK